VEPPDRHLYVVEGWGVGELWVAGGALVHHVLAGDEPALAEELPPTALRPRSGGPLVRSLRARIARHLAGRVVSYDDVPVALGETTPFERALADTLRRVPWGEVVTYGELAALAGRPGAARAAGSFCAAGGLSLVLPYHRVVAATGIGGWGADGTAVKRRLLALEGVRL
jgi:O-6-methylguanine DNA methyltransferase